MFSALNNFCIGICVATTEISISSFLLLFCCVAFAEIRDAWLSGTYFPISGSLGMDEGVLETTAAVI